MNRLDPDIAFPLEPDAAGDPDPERHLDHLLDAALEDSFPASDPLSTMRPAA